MQQQAILTGEFELTIDKKGRLMVPAEIRKSLTPERDGKAFFLIVGVNRRPWLYPERKYEELVSKAEEDMLPDVDTLAFDQIYFAMASRVEPDGQGRVLVPEKILRRTSTGHEVTMIGVRNHLELWNRGEWESQFDANLQQMGELARRARQARTPQQP